MFCLIINPNHEKPPGKARAGVDSLVAGMYRYLHARRVFPFFETPEAFFESIWMIPHTIQHKLGNISCQRRNITAVRELDCSLLFVVVKEYANDARLPREHEAFHVRYADSSAAMDPDERSVFGYTLICEHLVILFGHFRGGLTIVFSQTL